MTKLSNDIKSSNTDIKRYAVMISLALMFNLRSGNGCKQKYNKGNKSK